MRTLVICVVATLSALGSAAAAEPPQLSLPIDCKIGTSCFIQQYMDVDPGPGAQDYRCGGASYNKHSGTDFRVRNLQDVRRGVKVLAAAPGTILRLRDQVSDRIVRTAKDRLAVQNVFCGNGVVIDHGDGWRTQYCHLQKGSLQVKQGQKVKRGQTLGLVGFSGLAQFPHVHLTVSKDGKKVDPFTGTESPEACGENNTGSLWSPSVRKQLSYRHGQILASGFSAGRVAPKSVLWRLPDDAEIASNSKALVAYAWLINLQKGDKVLTQLTGPKGIIASETSKPLNRHKAQYVQYTGKKRPKGGWHAGLYVSEVSVIREGKRVLQHRKVLHLR
ncbi:MAG: M23 family metallopeptidase [Rhizobiales bacterium]|nr:M23 family metallopeptidase [Hyphomicrobiales bacterium]